MELVTRSIKVENEEAFVIEGWKMALLADELPDPDHELKRRLQWVVDHKCEQICLRFKEKWSKVLKDEGAKVIPLQDKDFVEMIVARPDYKTKQQLVIEQP